jgi:hypothetical protein
LIGKSSVNRFPMEMNMHATIDEPVSKQRIGKHTVGGIVPNSVFCGGRPEVI